MEKCLMSKEDLQLILKSVFQKDYQIRGITKLLGGAQKGTYKVDCSNTFSFVLYIWDDSLSYFSATSESEIFTSNSAFLFKKNHELLQSHAISVPKLYHIDLSKNSVPFEYALVQYIDGSDLETLLYGTQTNCHPLIADLKENLNKLHSIKSPLAGDLRLRQEASFSCKDYIKHSLDDTLDYLFKHYEPIKKFQENLIHICQSLYENIGARNNYSLIHWELGPNHVMVDQRGKTYLIDIEGVKFFDIEYEYSFLQFRFGTYYGDLISLPVDEHRMRYYKLYHHLSIIEGTYQLIQENYYDLSIKEIIDVNYRALLNDYLS